MTKTKPLAFLAGMLFMASPAIAQQTSAPAPAPVPEKKVCRMITPTGSIMGKRFCLTRAEWKKLNEINADSAETGLSGRRMRKQNGSDDF